MQIVLLAFSTILSIASAAPIFPSSANINGALQKAMQKVSLTADDGYKVAFTRAKAIHPDIGLIKAAPEPEVLVKSVLIRQDNLDLLNSLYPNKIGKLSPPELSKLNQMVKSIQSSPDHFTEADVLKKFGYSFDEIANAPEALIAQIQKVFNVKRSNLQIQDTATHKAFANWLAGGVTA